MQTQAQNLLEGFLSIYDFNQTINIPYQQKNSVEKSIFQHWNITGGYLKQAMDDFDCEQKNNKNC
ncbi:MAG: hypothetical protein FXV79_04590 [Candidatus Thioglobus sp.]|nr:MAG: hypothetical protein FXV79_04590 [Candidatus Thioglobus sp.]